MKTCLKLIPVLAILATACGGVIQRNGVSPNETVQSDETAQCSLSLAPHSNADAIQRAVQAVADGLVDPCAGSLAQRQLYTASLARIDQGDGADPFLVLVFWMRLLPPNEPPVQRP